MKRSADNIIRHCHRAFYKDIFCVSLISTDQADLYKDLNGKHAFPKQAVPPSLTPSLPSSLAVYHQCIE